MPFGHVFNFNDVFCGGVAVAWPFSARAQRPFAMRRIGVLMPITVMAVLSFSDIACSLSLVPLASVTCWRGGSTAGPFH
jgi:hypothetical protein